MPVRRDIQTVTLAFAEFRGDAADEAPLAEEVARVYGTRHTTRLVGEAEFRADLPRILDAMDQPSIDGINTWFVSKAARELGLKVAISGLGGDELFGGYPSFRDIPRWVAACCAALAGAAARQGRTHDHAPAGRQPRPQPESGRDAGATAAAMPAPICCGAACSCPGSCARIQLHAEAGSEDRRL